MMNWLSRLLGAVSPPVTGLEIDEPDPYVLIMPPAPGPFFRALGSLVGPEAVLYWEGPAPRLLKAWLRRQTREPGPQVAVGVSPVHDFYHIVLAEGILADLATRLEHTTPVPTRVHLHVHHRGRVVVQWRRAFREGPALLSRTIGQAQVESFAAAVGAKPTFGRAAT